MRYPSELDLLGFFGVEPIRDEDVTIYKISDSSGLVLTFSYCVFDDSLQTRLDWNGHMIAVVSQEGMTHFSIIEGVLRADFELHTYRGHLEVKVTPFIQVQWSGLRVG